MCFTHKKAALKKKNYYEIRERWARYAVRVMEMRHSYGDGIVEWHPSDRESIGKEALFQAESIIYNLKGKHDSCLVC